MISINRIIKINLPAKQSAFLWGPRKVGKSTFLRKNFSSSLYFDLLKTDLLLELSKNPSLLRERILAQNKAILAKPIIIDEVQKVPHLLNEVHYLIENKGLRFILCGSSARKLKHPHVNLLGGRAWRYEMFPLVIPELPDSKLLTILNRGTIPAHFLQPTYKRSLKGYIEDYLKEEVRNEGLTRNFPAFSRFFDALGYTHGELVNFSNISSDCGVDAKTIKEYFQILVDTLIGSYVEPFAKRQGRDVLQKMPKFYLFDIGLVRSLTKSSLVEEKGELFGKALEHFIFTELRAYRSYKEVDFTINYWRTKSGLEVDFILADGTVALEVKGGESIRTSLLSGIRAFKRNNRPKYAIVVSNEKHPRKTPDGIDILPWRYFLNKLWRREIIQ